MALWRHEDSKRSCWNREGIRRWHPGPPAEAAGRSNPKRDQLMAEIEQLLAGNKPVCVDHCERRRHYPVFEHAWMCSSQKTFQRKFQVEGTQSLSIERFNSSRSESTSLTLTGSTFAGALSAAGRATASGPPLSLSRKAFSSSSTSLPPSRAAN